MNMKMENPHYPVNALMGNVLDTFMKLNHEFDFQVAIEKGLDKKIVMVLTDKPITDVAELSAKNQIKLYDNFCQFYWCLCYSSLLMYDKGIIAKLIENNFQGNIDMSDPELKTAYEVFQTGVGLLYNEKDPKITERPVFFELPNPYNNINDYVGKANAIYCYGMTFILYHEYSHFIMEHSWFGSKKDEEDADSNAFWTIFTAVPKEEEVTAMIGIITALCALIFLDNTMKGDEVHPDGDIRVASALENIDPEYDHYRGIASMCFKMWAFHYGYDKKFPNAEESENWRQYFDSILNHLYYMKLARD